MNEMETFLEQLEAAHEVAHHYVCFFCNEFEGHKPVVIGIEDEEGVRAIIVTACVSCAKEIPDVTAEKSPTQTKGT